MKSTHNALSRRLATLIGFMLLTLPLSGRVVDDWEYRHPQPHNQNLWKVGHAEGVYVMIGNGGVLTTTSDLVNWESSFHPELMSLDGLLYAEGSFLVTSRSGRILTSPDGLAWTERATGTDKALLSAAYGSGRYVLTGEDGTTATSTDGRNWTLSDTGDDNWYFGVTHGNNLFVAAAFDWNHNNTGSIATSADGQNWNLVNLPASFPEYIEFYDVSYADGKFVASGYFYDGTGTEVWGVFIATSTDGVTWTRATNGVPQTSADDSTPVELNMIRYDEAANQWLGVGDRSVLMVSSDAVNWAATFPLGNSTADFYGIGFSPEGRVMVGSRANVYFSAAGTTDWEQKFTGSYTSISDIEYNGSLYVTTGSAIMTSSDGVDWTQQFGGQPGGTLANVVYGQGRWVAGSWNNTSDIPLTTSADGTNWAFPPTLPAEFTECRDLAFGNGIFVALPRTGTSTLVTSTDGLTWTGRNHPWFDAKLGRCHVIFGNGMFLAYNTGTSTVEIAMSTNGIDWTTADTGIAGSYYNAAYGDGRWVLVGNNGMVATSTDLATWSDQVIAFGSDQPVRLESVAYGNGHWVICGRSKSIWSSEDGLNWVAAFKTGQDGIANIFASTMFDGRAFWTVGSSGDILRSGLVLNPVTLSIHPSPVANTVLLELKGTAGDQWNILASPSLSQPVWSILTSVQLQDGTAIHTDSVSGDRFYLLSAPE